MMVVLDLPRNTAIDLDSWVRIGLLPPCPDCTMSIEVTLSEKGDGLIVARAHDNTCPTYAGVCA